MADLQPTFYPHKCRLSVGQGKYAGQRPTFYHCATLLAASRAYSIGRVTTCLENLEMSGNLTAVREMSGILLKIREMSGKKSCQAKVTSGKYVDQFDLATMFLEINLCTQNIFASACTAV